MTIATSLQFVTLDVFTSKRFLGNPLAIVTVPHALQETLSQDQKQTIAREFNLSETVFLHEGNTDGAVKIDIFTTEQELPIAGHPTIGTGWYLLSQHPDRDTVILGAKAGNIYVSRLEGGKIQLNVPHKHKVHAPQSLPRTFQPRLRDEDYVDGPEGENAVVSLVRGVTFTLLQLSSEEALSRTQPPSQCLNLPVPEDWAGFIAIYAFYEREDGVIRTRMFETNLEDPATGAAASTLAGWLAKKKGPGIHKFNILQGVEMGRSSEIEVVVHVGLDGLITEILLAGEVVEVMKGSLML